MKAKKESSNLIPYLAAGGIGLVALGSAFFLLRKKKGGPQNLPKGISLPKDLTIKILNELRRDLYPYYKKVQTQIRGIAEQTGQEVPVNEIRSELLSHGKAEIEATTREVLARHQIKESDFEYTCTITFKDDRDVKQKMAAIQEDVNNALEGKLDQKATIPESLTPHKTLDISGRIMKASLTKIHDAFQELADQGVDISLKNPRILMLLQDLKVDEIRNVIFRQEGLDVYEDHPEKILAFAVTKFAKIDPMFRMKYGKLEAQNMDAMQKIFKNSLDKKRAIDEVGEGIVGDDTAPVKFGRSQSIREDIVKQPEALPKLARLNTTAQDPSKNLANLDNIKRQIQTEFKKALEKSDDFKNKEGFVESALDSLMSVMSEYKPEKLLPDGTAKHQPPQVDIIKEESKDSAVIITKETTVQSGSGHEESKTEAHQVETHQVETHQVETHQVETHQVETHQVETHKVETHQVETHQVEEHKAETYQVETHQVETHQVETHKAETHQVETHQVETHQVETRKAETHQGDEPQKEVDHQHSNESKNNEGEVNTRTVSNQPHQDQPHLTENIQNHDQNTEKQEQGQHEHEKAQENQHLN